MNAANHYIFETFTNYVMDTAYSTTTTTARCGKISMSVFLISLLVQKYF